MNYSDPQAQSRARREKLIEMIRSRAMSPNRVNEVSGRVVPYGVGEGIAQLGQAMLAGKMSKDLARDEQAAIEKAKADADMQLEAQKNQADYEQEQLRSQNDIIIEREKIAAQAELERFKAQLKAETDLAIAQLKAQTGM